MYLLIYYFFFVSAAFVGHANDEQDSSLSGYDKLRIPWLSNQTIYNWMGHHNNLPRLLRMQQKSKWISVALFNSALIRWSLNCIYSLIKIGGVKSYIAATTDEESLKLCMTFRLPCYNATYLLSGQDSMGDVKLSSTTMLIGSKPYQQIVWAKVRLMQEILRLGFHVHFTDVDVVYLRTVYPSYRNIINRHRVDVIFMKETKSDNRGTLEDRKEGWERTLNLFNTGVYAIRSNNHSFKLVDRWLASNDGKNHDQMILNSLAFQEYVVCSGPGLCQAARQAGYPTIYRHPSQFGMQGVCPTGAALDPPCDPIRLFVHVVCKEGWGDSEGEKGRVLSRFKLWLVDVSGRPLFNEDVEGKGHSFLPCQGLAWDNLVGQADTLD